MGRVQAAVIALMLAACRQDNAGEAEAKPEPEGSGGHEPEYPDLILTGTPDCGSCREDHEQTCGLLIRWECRGGGTCGRSIPCDPICCSGESAQPVGLDQPPWGPILAATAADERPPTGVLAYHRDADLVLLRPTPATVEPTSLLRLPQPIDAWRWSAAHRQIVFAADQQLYRFDLATRATSVIPKARVSGTDFDLGPSGERAMVMLPGYENSAHSNADLLDLGDGSRELWTPPFGRLERPAWDPLGTRVAFEVGLGPRIVIRIIDVASRETVDAPWALSELRAPAWHPSGSFLTAWRVDAEGDRLVFIEPAGGHYAETAIRGSSASAIAFSPDGRHLAWVVDATIQVARLSSTLEPASIVTSRGAWSGLLWLDDRAAEALVELAGFVAACEECGPPAISLRTTIAARPLADTRIATLVAEHVDSPLADGLLAYVDVARGSRQIHAIAARGGRVRVLTKASAGAEGPAWSPDGGALVFVSGDRRQFGIIDLDGQRVLELAPREPLELGIPEWSHDGSSIAAGGFESSQGLTKVWTWHTGTLQERATGFPGSLDARPSWGSSALLVNGNIAGFDRLVHGPVGESSPGEHGEQLPRMIAPRWHPSGRMFAAWVGAVGHYELAWVDAEAGEWTATGVLYRAVGAASAVHEPAAIAFAPTGSHFVFARPDPERGDMTIEIAAIAEPTATTIVTRTTAGVGDVAWSVPVAAEHVAASKLPYVKTTSR